MKKKLKVILIVLIVLFSITGLGLLAVSPYLSAVLEYRRTALEIAAGSSAEDFRSTETSIIYDINGEEITHLSGEMELYYLEGSKIPDVVKKAFILTEDRKFYSHHGIDYAAIIRSGLKNIQTNSIVQGASTITQQLARNIYLTQDVTYERKITEMFLAMELEKKYSKEQILEFYINNIYFANGYYGIEAAAQGYFSAPAQELSLSELAFLVAIPNNPSRYDPVTKMEKTLQRRDYILKLLYDYGYISEGDYADALEEEIVLTRSGKNKCDYVETYVYYCATRALMAADGFVFRYEFDSEEEEEAYNDLYDDYYSRYQMSLFTGGYRIYTAIDMEKQALLQEEVNTALQEYTDTNEEGVYKMQASAVCIDNSTGYVTAIVGGRDQGLPGYTLNRAYQSFRQPGSAIKPLVVYAPFLGLGYNPDYVVDDSPMEGGPENFDERYPGESTLQEALAWSSNVVAWKLYEELTPEYGMSFLKKMHFRKLGDDDQYMSSCLGGWTYGTSALEMASGYAALAYNGIYREPTAVMRITDSKGTVLADNTVRGMVVYDGNAARMVNKMLQYGVEAGLAINARLDNAVVAAKTGTTTGNRDGWIVGYSMYYTTAVWVGCDLPETVLELTGGTYPMTIWKGYMEQIHEGLELKEFPEYYRYGGQGANNPQEYPSDGSFSGEEESDTEDGNGYIYGGDENASLPGDGNASGSLGGDENASGNVQGDGNASGNFGGDGNASGNVQGDGNASGNLGGDGNASGNVQGDGNASGNVGGDGNASGNVQGDGNAPGNLGGDENAPGSVGGDSNASGGLHGDEDARIRGE